MLPQVYMRNGMSTQSADLQLLIHMLPSSQVAACQMP